MKLLVDRITATPQSEHFEGSDAWWRARTGAGADDPAELAEPVAFDLRVSKLGEDILLEGSLRGAARLACARCDRPYREPLDERLRLVLEPAGARVPSEPEAAEALARDGLCLSDELEVGWYRGHELHLGSFLAEAVSLALPMQPLPPVDDRGRCVECGEDCSTPVESIEHAGPESPFAVLASLRNGREQGGS